MLLFFQNGVISALWFHATLVNLVAGVAIRRAHDGFVQTIAIMRVAARLVVERRHVITSGEHGGGDVVLHLEICLSRCFDRYLCLQFGRLWLLHFFLFCESEGSWLILRRVNQRCWNRWEYKRQFGWKWNSSRIVLHIKLL